MNRLFLKSQGHTIDYEELISWINSVNSYRKVIQTPDMYELFRYIISGILSDNEIILLDSDMTIDEINGIDPLILNKQFECCIRQYNTLDDIQNKILSSKSIITIYTSGTTGQPKKVSHRLENFIRSVRCDKSHEKDVWALAYNPTHMSGLQVFFQAFMNGNPIIDIFNKSRHEIFPELVENRVTHISGTPTFFRLLLPADTKFENIKRVTFGGEKSNKKLYSEVSTLFPNAKITNIYASTEAGALFAAKDDCFQIPNELKDKIKVEEGEILVHKSLLGYSDSFIFDKGYYHSGDIIEWVDQSQGLFKFISRKNEMINVGGYKVNPEEVEDVILSMEGINQAIVYGRANSVLGNVLCADIKLLEGYGMTEMTVRNYLQEKLQYYKVPRRIKFVEDLSVTRTGKIKRI